MILVKKMGTKLCESFDSDHVPKKLSYRDEYFWIIEFRSYVDPSVQLKYPTIVNLTRIPSLTNVVHATNKSYPFQFRFFSVFIR